MASDPPPEYTTIGIALGSAQQVMRLRPGDKFKFSTKTIRVDPASVDEFDILEQLPERILEGDDLLELLGGVRESAGLLLLAAEHGLDGAFLYHAYQALASHVVDRPELDPRLPGACLALPHVLEHLLRHQFDDGVIARTLAEFDDVATRRVVIRQRAEGAVFDDTAPELPAPGLLRTDRFTEPHANVMALLQGGDLAGARSLTLELCDQAVEAFGSPHPMTLLYLGQTLLAERYARDAARTLRGLFRTALRVLDEEVEISLRFVQILLGSGIELSQALVELGRLEEARHTVVRTIARYRDYTIGFDFEVPEEARGLILGQLASGEIDAVYLAAKLWDATGYRSSGEFLATGGLYRSWRLFDESPQAARLQLLLAKILADRGALDQGMAHFENARRHMEVDPAERLRWTFLRARAGDLERARSEIDGMAEAGALDDAPGLRADAEATLAEISEMEGEVDDAIRHRLEALRWSDRLLESASAASSTNEMLALSKHHFGHVYALADLVAHHRSTDDRAVRLVYGGVARRKYFATDVQKQVARTARDATEARALRAELEALRSTVGAARLLDHGALEFDPHLEDVLFRIEEMEARLARLHGEVGIPEVGTEDLVAALPSGGCIVEYLYMRPLQPSAHAPEGSPARYFAFVVGADGVRMADLGKADEIEDRIATWTRKIGAGITSLERYARAVLDRVWKPIADWVEESERLFIAPAGEIARLSFAALGEGGDFDFDGRDLSYVSTGRELLRERSTASAGGPPAVFADPDYDVGTDAPTEHGWTRLAGARAEGLEIAEMLGVTPYLDARASETELKALRSPSILHLATHGYFQDELATRKADLQGLEPSQVRRLALKGGGLLLAGANAVIAGSGAPRAGADEGVLNEMDILGLDLSGTELVVLSACDTGHGPIHVGEGVMGLERALQVAGAQTVVMSLWKVPDEVTRALMGAFYTELLGGASCTRALRKAQLAVREDHPGPASWGAFVCYGVTDPISASWMDRATHGSGR